MESTNPATGETAEPFEDYGIREFVDRETPWVQRGSRRRRPGAE
jgi:hypothetical protein